jgi:hypothetical protein
MNMCRAWRALLISLLTLMLSVGPVLAYEDQEQANREPRGEEMMADALVARPLGIFAMVLGAITFVVALPFTLPSGSTGSAQKALIKAPAVYTFKRPLGRFLSCEEQPDMCK